MGGWVGGWVAYLLSRRKGRGETNKRPRCRCLWVGGWVGGWLRLIRLYVWEMEIWREGRTTEFSLLFLLLLVQPFFSCCC